MNQRKAGVTILMLDKTVYRSNNITRDRTLYNETRFTRYSKPKRAGAQNRTAKYIKHNLIKLKREINKYSVIVGDSNTSQQSLD